MVNEWYKEAAVYQIWPRSFKDGNGDGIGDLWGVLEKLDYIKSLGVDAIWFSPLYPSPQADFGYDIADYRDICSDYGTLEVFKQVLDGAHERGLKVIMDLVVNHTSDEHEWFKESKKGDDNPYHDYYFWRKGKGKDGKKPPNNWLSLFEGKAWEYDETLGEYYLHLFAKKQPDLNMDNPKVREEVKGIMEFWLSMGVDGFREDVITFISKAEGLPDGFPLPAATGIEHYRKGPHLLEYLTEFQNDVLKKYDAFTVGEAPMMTPERALEYVEEGKNQVLNMMFHFQHMNVDCIGMNCIRRKFKLTRLKKVYNDWQKKLYRKGWNALYIENHDQPRIVSRYGNDKEFHDESAKMLATMYICQSGTPFIYQGQEIGMTNIHMDSLDDYVDVAIQNDCRTLRKFGFSDEKILKTENAISRDNARTPVQWSAKKNAGFTDGETPWFKINPNYKTINVASQEKDKNSVLNYYRKLLKTRKENPVLIYGDFEEHYKSSEELFVYERNYEGKRALVICSFSPKTVTFRAPAGFRLTAGKLLICNYKDAPAKPSICALRPYEARVYLYNA